MLAYFLHYFKLFQLATPMVNGPDFVIANLTLNLTCTANGIDSTSNATTFTWSKDGVTLSNYTGPQLTKTALTSDSGLYALGCHLECQPALESVCAGKKLISIDQLHFKRLPITFVF
jgi:hypothetical protein